MERTGSSTSPQPGPSGNSVQLSATEYQAQQQQKEVAAAAAAAAAQQQQQQQQSLADSNLVDEDGDIVGRNGSDAGDSKRRRIARACDQCRKKKIKCDGKTPACSHCQNYHTECVFTLVEKKRQPPKGAKYIEGLENRLGRMESLLKLSGILPEFDAKTDLGTLEKKLEAQRAASSSPGGIFFSRPVSASGTPSSSGAIHGSSPSDDVVKDEDEPESLTDKMSSLVTNARGETRFIGSSSGFSIFSPKGIQWVNSKTGDKAFQRVLVKLIQADHKFEHWRPDVWDAVFSTKVTNPLPSKSEAISYAGEYFRTVNALFPLYHQQTFESLLEDQYSNNPPQGTGWLASLNMVLAIGSRIRGSMLKQPSADEDSRGWKYFQNAMCLYPVLTLQNTDFLSIQALLAMALFLQGTANPQPLYNIISAALRVSFSIGLHRRADAFGFGREEAEHRKRVFWIAYVIDKDIALRSGRPSIINDDDMNIELPEEESFDGLGMIELAGGRGKVNLFRRTCRFAQIQSRVYMQLYSAKAAKQSDGELLNTIGDLDRELEEWRDSIPLDVRPEHAISNAYELHMLSLVLMHFQYFNCLATIHRMSIAHSYWTNRLAQYAVSGLSPRPLNPRVFSSAALSVSAARSSIHLLKYINQADINCIWLVFYYPVTALITLFANILQNPQDSNAKTDLKLMGVVVQFLTKIDEQERTRCGFEKLIYITEEFDRLARAAIERAEKQALIRRKRKKTAGTTKLKVEGGRAPDVLLEVPDEDEQQEMNWSPSQMATPTQHHQHGHGHGHGLGTSAVAGGSNNNAILQTPSGTPFEQTTTPSEAVPGMEGFTFTYSTPGATPQVSEGGEEFSPLTKSFQESFSSPFVPQSLWNLNQTFEWDWANVGLVNGGGSAGGLGLGDEAGSNTINWDGMQFF
ncbi:hypothetical protein DRE_01419 [Drechslerella stenobrocha 248]|uniref:Zn(2)-C6 fungal-type domain-containing protein n=1 Tax=Drechslerella stenobrocha 248 TaxID=1043628 RepID=W7HVK1_9PEZI|nr:hypothetical protein DRE_01419 [Drechslerella stenobrocha 248]